MTTAKQRIKQQAANRRRSAFRDEFYKDGRKQPSGGSKARGGANGGPRRLPLWLTVGGLGVLLCIIAVGGSSAMIWLRKLGALFGVYWVGD